MSHPEQNPVTELLTESPISQNGYYGRVATDQLSALTINVQQTPEEQQIKWSDIPIGCATVEAYGYTVSPDIPIVIDSSFNTPASTGIIPGIMNAAETNHETTLAATTITSGEIAVIPQQVGEGDQNMVVYWRRKGVTPQGARVIPVPLHIESNGGFHYPHTDPLWQAYLQGIHIPPSYLINSFPHAGTKEVAEKLRLIAVQNFDPADAGDKVNFHKGLKEYGYDVSLATVVTSLEEIHAIYDNFMSDEFGYNLKRIWLKILLNSSGGGGVISVNFADFASWEDLGKYLKGITDGMYNIVKKAFLNGDNQSDDLDAFWSHKAFTPTKGILVEVDMNIFEYMDPASYSNTLFIAEDRGHARVYEIAEFEQIFADDGSTFLGSLFIEEVNQEADPKSSMGKLGEYLFAHGVRGFVGADYKIRKPPNELEKKILIEPNIRLSMSEHARRAYLNFIRALAQRGIILPSDMTFANKVFEIPQGIHEVSDIERFYDNFACPDIADITLEDLEKGVAISIGNGSFVTDTGEIVVSTETRTLIVAPKDKIRQVMQEMTAREEKEKKRYEETKLQAAIV